MNDARSPVPLQTPQPGLDVRALADDLAHRIAGEVRFDPGSRSLYATDASNYRQLPIGVVLPRSVDDVLATLALCRRHDVPVLARGAGTSLSGQTELLRDGIKGA